MRLPVDCEFNLVITGFGDESNQIAKSINERGIVGLRYIKGASEVDSNSKVTSLNAYRDTKARIQEGYHMAIIVISENDIDGHLKNIGEFRKNSGVTLVFVLDVENKDFSQHQGLRRLFPYADSVFPVTTCKNQLDEVYGTVRALIEAFTVQTITGVDITDIAGIVRNAGMGTFVQFKVPQNQDIVEYLEKHIYSQITRQQLLNAHGALITTTGDMGMNDLQFTTEFLNENSCFNITCVTNLLESMGDSREITLVFTGVGTLYPQ